MAQDEILFLCAGLVLLIVIAMTVIYTARRKAKAYASRRASR